VSANFTSTQAYAVYVQVVKQAYKLQQSTPQYAQLGVATFKPLPAAADGATYPVFNEYPVGSVELQQLERRRIQEAEDALLRRRRVSRSKHSRHGMHVSLLCWGDATAATMSPMQRFWTQAGHS
jgi:negative regulator of sigma E activity